MKGTITGFQNECSFLLEILCLFVLTCVAKETEVTNNAVSFYSVVATKQKKKKEKEDAIKIEDVTPTDTDTTEEKEPSNPAPHQPPPPPPPPPVPGMWSKLNQASIERFLSRDLQISKFITTEQSVYVKKRFNSHSTVWDTNMTAVTSCGNDL